MNRDSVLKKHRHNFPNKGLYSQSYGFLTSQVWMWELDHKEGWLLKNWWFQTVVLEKTLESPLDSKEIKPVHTKWNQPWILVGRTDAKAEPPILWPPDAELIGKHPDAGKDWRQKEKREAKGETVGWHVDGCHELDGSILNGCEFEQTLRDSGGQGSLACCSPWGHKKKDTTEQQQPESILQSCPRFLIPRAVLSCCFCKKLLCD